jgi:16S rRNA (cytosine1402-N4)-methyltransferase
MPDAKATFHQPVMLREVLETAAAARRVVDATLGHGGHAEALRAAGADVLGIDRDPDALATARVRLGDERITYLESAYADPAALAAVARFHPDFVLLDLGVSSRQLDAAERGFTFRPGAPLDMRMGAGGPSAADFINEADEDVLASAFADWGDERRARRLAAEIVRRRANAAFATSDDLVNAIRGALGPRTGPPDFARLFQAVRIAVNDELDGLARALPAFRDALAPGGRLAVISYHSGEDRLVKHAFREWSRDCICPPAQPVCTCRGKALGSLVPRRQPLVPDQSEIDANPRARSAKLRVFQVTDAA